MAETTAPADALEKLADMQESNAREVAREATLALLRLNATTRVSATEAVAAGVSRPRFLEICAGSWDAADRTFREMHARLVQAELAARADEGGVDRGAEVSV